MSEMDCADLKELDDPDVTGLLVVISFTTSFIVTIAVTIFSYLSRTLPPTVYNDIDELALSSLPISKLKTSTDQSSRTRKLKALGTLLTSLSDQHLVTGSALLISFWIIFANASGAGEIRSVYSVQVATSLATVSSVIHLSSLSVLKHVWEDHRPLKLRVLFIALLLSLLLPARVLTIWGAFCRYDITVFCARSNLNQDGPGSVSDIIFEITYVLYLYRFAYQSIAHDVFRTPTVRDICSRREYWKQPTDADIILLQQIRDNKNRSSSEGFLQWYRRMVTSNPRLTTRGTLKIVHLLLAGIGQYFPRAIARSFLSNVLFMLFLSSYGLTELWVIYTGWPDGRAVRVEASFGQLMPIFLMALSIFAITDAATGPPEAPLISRGNSPHLLEDGHNNLQANQESVRQATGEVGRSNLSDIELTIRHSSENVDRASQICSTANSSPDISACSRQSTFRFLQGSLKTCTATIALYSIAIGITAAFISSQGYGDFIYLPLLAAFVWQALWQDVVIGVVRGTEDKRELQQHG
ncbi:hypothetical protein JX266_008880 [Neoarthrinium moseri]|nr:hypothetical protein JX266_008880 [Neoarthrinium moseri]